MGKFKSTTLRNKIHIKHGFSFKGEFFATEGDYIILTPGNFYESGGFKFDIEKAKFYNGEFPKEYICSKGDLVVAMTEQAEGLLGSSAIVPEDNRFLHNQRIGLVTVDENEIDKQFLYHVFNTKSVRQQLRSSSSGSKVKHTSPDRIYDVIVNIPPLSTQQKIAAVLSALDAKIELNQRINAELEQVAKTLYDYWFVQFAPHKSAGGKMVWNEELKRDVPAGWEVKPLGDILKTHLGGTPSTKNPEYWENATIPWLNSGDLTEFPIIKSSSFVTQKGVDNSATTILPKGSVVISLVRYIRPSIITMEACANQSVVGIRESKELKNTFIYPSLVNEIPRLMSLRTGAQQPHINKETIDSTLLCIPPKKVLEKYYEITEPIYSKIMNCAFESQTLTELRDWLLSMLMNGQVKVS